MAARPNLEQSQRGRQGWGGSQALGVKGNLDVEVVPAQQQELVKVDVAIAVQIHPLTQQKKVRLVRA